MPRVTRAKAAELAETLHIDEGAVLDLNDNPIPADKLDLENFKTATPEPNARSRSPLGEIAPNSAEGKNAEEEGGKGRKARKAGRKRKGKKGGDGDLGASVMSQPEDVETREGEMKEDGEVSQSPAATSEEEEESSIPAQAVEETTTEEALPTIAIDTTPSQEQDMNSPPASPIATATPRVIQSLRKETSGKRSTSNKENVEPFSATPISTPSAMRVERSPATAPYDELEVAAMGSPAPSMVRDLVAAIEEPAAVAEPAEIAAADEPVEAVVAGPSVIEPSSPKSENPIEALDELEEAVEKVSQEIPEVVASPEKKKKQVVLSPVQTKTAARSKPAPVVRTTKASQARLSLAQGPKVDTSKAPSLGRPRPSTTLGRSGSVRQSTVPSAPTLGRSSSVRQSTAPGTLASKRVTSTSSNASTARSSKPTGPREKTETVIPHSKTRPISLSFPTPPPPQRSSKPTTKSSFQLPGEAVAAKLKAAREERMKNELSASTTATTKPAEGQTERKASFKARPAPSTTLKKTPSVRHTAASRAREGVANGTAPAPVITTLKRSNTVPSSRPPRPSTSAAPSASLTSSKRSTAAPRPSTAAAPTRVTSTSSALSAGTAGPTKTTVKGKEVFNRAAVAKADAEKEKREKEEAAKKARAEAAERGRQASREWAEKQKARKAAAAAANKPAGVEA